MPRFVWRVSTQTLTEEPSEAGESTDGERTPQSTGGGRFARRNPSAIPLPTRSELAAPTYTGRRPRTPSNTEGGVRTRRPEMAEVRGLENSNAELFLAHSTLTWLGYFFWALAIAGKLNGNVGWSWWVVFIPSFVYHALQVVTHSSMIIWRERVVGYQLGRRPTVEEHGESVLASYIEIYNIRITTHVVNNINFMIDTISLCIVKVVFCGSLVARVEKGAEWPSFWIIFMPCWISWGLTSLVARLRNHEDRGAMGSMRDLQYIFMIFVAAKLDGVARFSWVVVFVVPWLIFGITFILSVILLLLLLFASTCRADKILQTGVLLLAMGFSPLYLFFMRLVPVLDGRTELETKHVMLPCIVCWAWVWVASIVIYYGLRLKDRRGQNVRLLQALVNLQLEEEARLRRPP
mmetsp:Transcript_5461/g.18469  ORF Transcript_5461/g.18469 Transcript_5461/m.18469 type:complete len:406 (-) Transcript_5461:37-1254(-)